MNKKLPFWNRFLRALSGHTAKNPHGGRVRPHRFRFGGESLEPRRLLSLAPAAADDDPPLSDWLAPSDWESMPIFEAPYEPPSEETRGDAEPNAPDWTWEPAPTPPYSETPDEPPPDGLVDIGNKDGAAADDVFSGHAADAESRQVLEMLSSLQYVPTPEPEVPSLPASVAAGTVEHELLADPRAKANMARRADAVEETAARVPAAFSSEDARNLPEDKPRDWTKPWPAEQESEPADPAPEQTPKSTDNAPADDSLAAAQAALLGQAAGEGGMVVVFPYASREAPVGHAKAELRGDLPAPMKGVYGKFQAFEISTADEDSPPAADETTVRPPLNAAAVATFFASVVYATHAPRGTSGDGRAALRLRRATQGDMQS
jgi:hypothetical protein